MHDAVETWNNWVEEYDLMPFEITHSSINPATGGWIRFRSTMYKCPECGALYQMDHDTEVHTMWIDRMIWDSNVQRQACRCDALFGEWDLETLEVT